MKGAVLLRAERARLREAKRASKTAESSAKERLALSKSTCKVLVEGMTTECRRRRFPADLDCFRDLEHVLERCRATQAALRERIAEERKRRGGIRARVRALAPPGRMRAVERRAESDDKAAYDIPEELHDLWRRERKRFGYDLAPDRRALAFLDWAERHPDAVRDYMVARWDRMEREAEQMTRDRVDDEVPF